MKKYIVLALACVLVLGFAVSCKPKVKPAPVVQEKPQVKEQPKVEKAEPPAPVTKPALTEEELFLAKSLDQINKEKPLAMIHFDYDKYAVRDDAKSVMESNAAWLKRYRTAKILIEGHCDERGGESYNNGLGERRAQASKNHLVMLGIDPSRIETVSYGKTKPFEQGRGEKVWKQNRRAHFVVLK